MYPGGGIANLFNISSIPALGRNLVTRDVQKRLRVCNIGVKQMHVLLFPNYVNTRNGRFPPSFYVAWRMEMIRTQFPFLAALRAGATIQDTVGWKNMYGGYMLKIKHFLSRNSGIVNYLI